MLVFNKLFSYIYIYIYIKINWPTKRFISFNYLVLFFTCVSTVFVSSKNDNFGWFSVYIVAIVLMGFSVKDSQEVFLLSLFFFLSFSFIRVHSVFFVVVFFLN